MQAESEYQNKHSLTYIPTYIQTKINLHVLRTGNTISEKYASELKLKLFTFSDRITLPCAVQVFKFNIISYYSFTFLL